MKYHLHTLGCAKNTVDSWRMESALRSAGHAPSENKDAADLLLVNTCGFIDDASEESVNLIKELDSERRSDQKLWVAGCLTEIATERVQREIPGVDQTFGAQQWDEIALKAGPSNEAYDIPIATMPGTGVYAYLKISDGCDRPCTFCIIPTIKGGMVSSEYSQIIADAKEHIAAGAKELIIIGQDTTAFGEDWGSRDGLADLLEVLSGSIPDDIWIRLMYAYPGRVTKRLASVMSRAPNIIPYVDMPLQHGSESVLKRMKRPSLKKANESLSILKEAMPDISLRTTFIVGFPGETDREFEELLDFIEKWQFNHVGAFNYSPQVGTPATSLPEATVDTQVATERFGEVMTLAQEISHRHTKALVGKSIDVLIESEEPGQNADGEFISIGRSYRDAPEVDGLVFVKGAYHQGDKISAEVSGALPYDVFCNSGQSG